MILLLIVAQTTSLGATNYTIDVPMKVPTAAPAFADEFDGKVIDRTKWRFDTSRNAVGWHNNEKQYYAGRRLNNARIENGALVLEARKQKLPRAQFQD